MKTKIVLKKDYIIIAAVLLVALVVFIIFQYNNKNSTPTGEVEIYVNGEFYKNVEIKEGSLETIEQKDGSKNTISFTQNGVYMHSSTCNNQLCVHQGEVNFENYKTRFLGNSIICLPNRVVVSLLVNETTDETTETAPDAY